MQETEMFMILGVTFLCSMLILVPFLLYHQRKMAEIVHRRSAVADELSKRLDLLTEAVFQLANRLDHSVAARIDGQISPPPIPELRENLR